MTGVSGLDVAGVVAGLVALVILVDISVLWILGRPVPELLGYLATSVFGFYFGRDRGAAARGPRANGGGGVSGGVVVRGAGQVGEVVERTVLRPREPAPPGGN